MLLSAGEISLEEALLNANSRTDLSLLIRLAYGAPIDPTGGLALEPPLSGKLLPAGK